MARRVCLHLTFQDVFEGTPPQTTHYAIATDKPLPPAHPAPGQDDLSGRSPGSRVIARSGLPGTKRASGFPPRSPLTVAGAAADQARRTLLRSLFIRRLNRNRSTIYLSSRPKLSRSKFCVPTPAKTSDDATQCNHAPYSHGHTPLAHRAPLRGKPTRFPGIMHRAGAMTRMR